MGGNHEENRKKNEGAEEHKWPGRYSREMETLRREIGEKEKKGVNVTRAWRLFGIARKLSRKEDAEKAFDYIEKVRGDLEWKEKLYEYSTRTRTRFVAYGVPILVAVPLIAYIIAKCGFHYDFFAEKPITLAMPTFIIAWGYVGSVAYVLISVHNKISKRLLDKMDPIGYLYRVVLGGILAGVIFYIIQMGLVSLPGTAGDEVDAALGRAGIPAKYIRNSVDKSNYENEIYENNKLINDFKSPEDVILTEHGYEELLGKPGEERDAYVKANFLIKYKLTWLEQDLSFNFIEADGSKNKQLSGKIDIDKIRLALSEKKFAYIEQIFGKIKNKVIKELEGQIEEKERLLKEITIKTSRMKYRLESAMVDDEITELRSNMDGLVSEKGRLEDWLLTMQTPGITGTETPGAGIERETGGESASKVDELIDGQVKLKIINEKIENKKEELDVLKEKRKAARKREEEKPVWESAVFIVIAFFSGYSINFVTKMFDRAMTAIISGKPGATETEGEVPHEPETRGEEP